MGLVYSTPILIGNNDLAFIFKSLTYSLLESPVFFVAPSVARTGTVYAETNLQA